MTNPETPWRAIQACFRELKVSSPRPILGRFLEKAQALARPADRRREPSDITTDVFLECLQPPRDKPHLAGVRKPVYVRPLSRQSDPDYVAACAESMRQRFNRLYGGSWIVVRTGGGPVSSGISFGQGACPVTMSPSSHGRSHPVNHVSEVRS